MISIIPEGDFDQPISNDEEGASDGRFRGTAGADQGQFGI
jgi:hypothetical protein